MHFNIEELNFANLCNVFKLYCVKQTNIKHMNKIYFKNTIVLAFIAITIIACKKENTAAPSDANFNPSKMFNVSFTDESHLAAKFTDNSKDAASYYWNFGDGTSSTDQNPTHTYKDSGTTKQYTITRVVVGKAGYRDTLQGYIYVYSTTPKIGNILYCQAESYGGEYRIVIKAYWNYAKKVDFYLKKSNGESILLDSIKPSYSSSGVDYNGYDSKLKIGNFIEATVNQAYKLKMVFTGSTGITKDTTIDVKPLQISKIVIESVNVISTPGAWNISNPLNLATTEGELSQVDPAKTIIYPNSFVWNLNTTYDYNDDYKKMIYRLNEEDGSKPDPDHSHTLDYANLPLPDQTGIPPGAVLLRQYTPNISATSYKGETPVIVKVSYHYE